MRQAHSLVADTARNWYDRAVRWMNQRAPRDPELIRFRAEAATLLGLPVPSTSTAPGTQPSSS